MPSFMDMALVGIVTLFISVVIILLFHMQRSKKLDQRIKKITTAHKPKTQAELIKLSLKKVQPDKKKNGFGSISGWLLYRLTIAKLDMTPQRYLVLNLLIMVFATCLLMLFSGLSPLLALLLGFIAGIGIPHFYIGYCINRQMNLFLKLFPDAIDLIVRGLRAGLPVAQTMQTIVSEVPDPISSVFREMCDQIAVGVNLEKAMADMAKRLNLTEFDFFVTSITLQRETGGNLTEILGNLSEVLRSRHMMKLKIKAMTSEAKASSTIVGSLPFLLFIAVSILSPGYMDPLFDDYRGNIALGGAFLSLGTGVFIMIRMAKFEI